MAAIPHTAKMKKVIDKPTVLSNIGKNRPTRKFVIHKQKTVTPIPSPRNFSGKISDNISQVTGEIAPCWNARKVTVKLRTTNGSAGDPLSTNENTPIRARAAVVPVNPAISIGRRPILPNSQIPTKVATTEIAPLAILPIRAALVEKPDF